MTLDQIIEEFRVCNYVNFDYFYNETKKNVFFSIAAIIDDKDIIDDLMQDTYIRFLENIDKYKTGTSINAYLSTIAHNISINYYNREKRLIHNDEVIEVVKDREKDPYDEIEAIELLKDLEPLEKQVVVLHVLNDLKFREIADIIQKPLGTVLWIYNKAIAKLKKKGR